MARPSRTDLFFRRYPWIRPTLWVLVGIWSIYLARKPIFFVRRISWSCSTVIFGCWWAILQTVLHLVVQLCVAVPMTALAYAVIAYGTLPVLEIVCAHFIDLFEAALKPPPPPTQTFRHTHTHSNGETYTHTYTEEEVDQLERLREAMLMRAMAEMREEMQREQERDTEQHDYPNGSGKAKRKAKKRNRHAH
ncbi:hypothetical protein FIBSPDRAFT_1050593 [Athelia psychrophila]|uniref:Transmembrane protein n=1 Tax=Athelia psychrophila TaxID=1759441 RepID=A0A166AJI9_9AGAM|nr:hypothetical protein FIBSPDRAFT_1050593 [Fibularhizoctonia sp. CBS 109695]